MLKQIDQLANLDILEQLTDRLFENSDLAEAQKLVNTAYIKQKSLE